MNHCIILDPCEHPVVIAESRLRFVVEKAMEADKDTRVVNGTSEGIVLMEAHRAEGQSALALVEQKARELACTLLASEPSVKVFVFGSRATGRSVTRSDIDLGIDLAHPIAQKSSRRSVTHSTICRSCNEWM